MPMVDTDVFLLHVDKYEVGDSTPGCMSHRFIRAVFMQRWADPWSIGKPERKLCDGPGISQRAAAARTQTVWRWLVYRKIL